MSGNEAHEHGGSTKLFLWVWAGLLGLTAIEVFLAYIQLPLGLMLSVLMGLSIVKAVLIVAYFMHLRFEKLSLVMVLIPMWVMVSLLLFVFFPDSFRLQDLRWPGF